MLLLGCVLALLLPPLTESFTISLQSTDNITIHIKRVANPPSPPCFICAPSCKELSLEISRGKKVDYTFSCNTPERYFIMEINRTVDCSSGVCPPNIILQPSNLHGLNRTFIWNILASKNDGLILGFSSPWLRQIHPSSLCSDLVSFKISTYFQVTPYSIGTFCRNGTITRIEVQGRGVITLSLPWNVAMTDPGINITKTSSIKRLSIVESTFHQESLVTLLSANYPGPFPNNQQMTWKFNFPEKYAAGIQILNATRPTCVNNEENTLGIFYYLPRSTLFMLSDNQPGNIHGNFNLSLQNCEVDDRLPGLNLNFTITVQKSQGNESYALDLRKEEGLVVRIRQRSLPRSFTPVCLICKEATDCHKELVIEGGKYYRISFFCENRNNLVITAVKRIECWNLTTCNIRNMPLTIPQSIINFPIRLESYTWKLIAPTDISAELVSKSTYLQQDVSDKQCNTTAVGYNYDIITSTNKENYTFATFCPNGSIEKIQMRDNVTIILKLPSNGDVKRLQTHDLHVSFIPFIEEESIFTVSPRTEDAIFLETPHWEDGLPDYVSVSWNINLPKKRMAAKLKFGKERMDISCEMNRVYVRIKEQKDYGHSIVRREDELLPSNVDMSSAFWVNVSSCQPRKGSQRLKLQFSITFNQTSPDIRVILIGVASAVGVVLAILITICCIKKKKKQLKAPVGIYSTEVNTEAPRRHAIFKKRKTNESHIYDVIDDTMVYGHLLQETNGTDPEVDVYRPFEGPMGEAPPIPPISNGSTRVDRKDGNLSGDIHEEPLALSMQDNEIYMFSQSISREPVENEDTSITYMDDSRRGTMTSV
ncbi:CUB domain containing protein 1, partial [Pristimantis euphronides]